MLDKSQTVHISLDNSSRISGNLANLQSPQHLSLQREERMRLLRVACDRHQEMYRDAMCGKGVDRHLFALYVVKRYLEEESPFLDKIFPPTYLLSTSQTPLNQCDEEVKVRVICAISSRKH